MTNASPLTSSAEGRYFVLHYYVERLAQESTPSKTPSVRRAIAWVLRSD